MEIDLVSLGRRQLTEAGEQIASPPQLGAVSIRDFLEADDPTLLVWPRIGDCERGNLFLAFYVVSDRGIAIGGTRKNTTAGREDHVRLVGKRLYDHLSTNSLCFANQSDEGVFRIRHSTSRSLSPLRQEPRLAGARFPFSARGGA